MSIYHVNAEAQVFSDVVYLDWINPTQTWKTEQHKGMEIQSDPYIYIARLHVLCKHQKNHRPILHSEIFMQESSLLLLLYNLYYADRCMRKQIYK